MMERVSFTPRRFEVKVLITLVFIGLLLGVQGLARAVDDPVVDNFDNDNSSSDQAAVRDAGWFAVGMTYQMYTESNLAGNTTPALRIGFTKMPGQEWGYLALGSLDAEGNRTNYSTDGNLALNVMGSLTLKFKFKDTSNRESSESDILVDSPSSWTKITWNYGNVPANDCDLSHIREILIFPKPGQVGSGLFYVDNVEVGLGTEPPVTPTLTPTPTATPTATATPNRLVDNFNNDNTWNDQAGARDAGWFSTGGAYQFSMTSGLAGNDTPALKIDFNKTAGQEWSYVALGSLNASGNRTDYSGNADLALHVYGNVNLKFKFKDTSNRESGESDITVNSPTQWSNITWNYGSVPTHSCDLTQIAEILIFPQPGTTGSGTFYIDNVEVGPGSQPPVPPTFTPTATVSPTATRTSTVTATRTPTSEIQLIDNFNNDNSWHDQTGSRDCEWFGSGSGIFQFAMMSNQSGNYSPSLKITYNKAAGQEWNYVSLSNLAASGNRTDYSTDTNLSLHAIGALTLKFKFKDTSNRESGESDIALNSPNSWTKIIWNYGSVPSNGCDMAHISEILVFPAPGQTGSGTFYVDNVMLGTGGDVPTNWENLGSLWYLWEQNLNLLGDAAQHHPDSAVWNGQTYLAWNKRSGSPYSLAVVRWSNGWTGIGGLLNQNSAAAEIGSPSLAVVQNVLYAAWHEDGKVYVKRLENGAWVSVGGVLNLDASHGARFPSLAGEETLHAAFIEQNAAGVWQTYVRRWDGSQWVTLGGSLNSNPGLNAAAPLSLAMQSAAPYLAWSEADGAGINRLRVKTWNGQQWTQLGGTLNQVNNHAAYPSLGFVGGEPYVAFQQSDSTGKVWVKRFSGGSWQTVGGSLNVNPYMAAGKPRLVMVGNMPYVAFIQDTTYPEISWSGGLNYMTAGAVYVSYWYNGYWNTTGSYLNSIPTQPVYIGDANCDVYRPALALNSGQLYTAWCEGNYWYNRPAFNWLGRWQVKTQRLNLGTTGAGVRGGTLLSLLSGKIANSLFTSPTLTPTQVILLTATPTPQATPSATSTATLSMYAGSEKLLAFPNPARGRVTFAWAGENADRVKVEIFNLSGERIAQLEQAASGTHLVAWMTGQTAPGVYLYRMTLTRGGKNEVRGPKKFTVIR